MKTKIIMILISGFVMIGVTRFLKDFLTKLAGDSPFMTDFLVRNISLLGGASVMLLILFVTGTHKKDRNE